MDWNSIISAASPELFLAIVGLIGVLIGAVMREKFSTLSLNFGAAILVVASVLSLAMIDGGTAFGGLWETDRYTNLTKAACYFCGAVSLVLAEQYLVKEKLIRFEYALLVIFACLGIGISLAANDLMTLYLGIETLSLSSYVLAAFNRDSQRSSEAGLKYFVLGSLASGIILYGASLVYGFTGSTGYDAIAASEYSLGLLFGLVLLITGLAFKVSAAPLHVWTPDVYEGAPTPVVAFFASAPKLGAMIVFGTLMFEAFGSYIEQWQQIILIIAGASMIIGAVGALRQTNIKRLFAYSSIGNMGYALIALAAGEEAGGAALLVYMVIYALSQLGIFGVILSMRRRGGMVEDISELSGLSTSKPWLAVCMTALVFSVAGIPPLGGFFGKLVVFQAGVEAGLWPIVIIGVLASVVSLGYYLKIIMIMWGGDKLPAFQDASGTVSMTVTGATLLVFPVFVIIIGWMMALVGGNFALG